MTDSKSEPPLKVCMVAPLPPPYGGVAHWTTLVLGYAVASAARVNVRVCHVDVAPRGRAVYDLRVWKRVLFGAAGMTGQMVRLWRCLVAGSQVVHLTTS